MLCGWQRWHQHRLTRPSCQGATQAPIRPSRSAYAAPSGLPRGHGADHLRIKKPGLSNPEEVADAPPRFFVVIDVAHELVCLGRVPGPIVRQAVALHQRVGTVRGLPVARKSGGPVRARSSFDPSPHGNLADRHRQPANPSDSRLHHQPPLRHEPLCDPLGTKHAHRPLVRCRRVVGVGLLEKAKARLEGREELPEPLRLVLGRIPPTVDVDLA